MLDPNMGRAIGEMSDALAKHLKLAAQSQTLAQDAANGGSLSYLREVSRAGGGSKQIRFGLGPALLHQWRILVRSHPRL